MKPAYVASQEYMLLKNVILHKLIYILFSLAFMMDV